MTFYNVEFPCGLPLISWYTEIHSEVKFRTCTVVEFQHLDVDSIICKNAKGQVINTARAVGTDTVNAAGIKESFQVQGIDPQYLPPIVAITSNDSYELVDGFTRQSVLEEIQQQKWVYLIVRIKEGFDIEDVKDELGLGCNNHTQSKKATSDDFKKRLIAWVNRTKSDTFYPDEKDCLKWFSNIPHSFPLVKVKKIIDSVLNAVDAEKTMESFSKPKAKKRGAELLGINPNSVVAFDNKSGASLERCLLDVVRYYDTYNSLPSAVGFTNRVGSQSARKVRQNMAEDVDFVNSTFRLMFKEYKRAEQLGTEDSFEVIKLEGFIPQIIDVEDDIIRC